jgi:hypothetical protein
VPRRVCADAGAACRRRERGWRRSRADLARTSALFGCPLLGGDTVSTPGPLDDFDHGVWAHPAGKMVHRQAAPNPGDRVVVTGTIGDAALGLDILKGGAVAAALAEDAATSEDAGWALSRFHSRATRSPKRCAITPCADGCVGWSGGGSRQAVRGIRRVGRDRRAEHPVVEAVALPKHCSPAAQSASRRIVTGGDDYEVLCAIPEGSFAALRHSRGWLTAPSGGAAVLAISGCRVCPIVISDLDRDRYPCNSRRASRPQGFWTSGTWAARRSRSTRLVLQPFLGFNWLWDDRGGHPADLETRALQDCSVKMCRSQFRRANTLHRWAEIDRLTAFDHAGSVAPGGDDFGMVPADLRPPFWAG